MQYARLKRSAKRELSPTAKLPTFQEIYGHPETDFILTRVERQIAGGRIPDQLSTFRKLLHAKEFDPFHPLILAGVGKPEPNPSDYDVTKYMAGMYLRRMISDDGIHRVRQFLNRHSTRNASRTLKEYADFLPHDKALIDPKGLYEVYQQSVSKQLAA